jgi:kinesin family protein C1
MASRRNNRLSLNPSSAAASAGGASPLHDAASRANRRTSFGGGNYCSPNTSPSPQKMPAVGGAGGDRRAMLDEWRKARGRPATAAGGSSGGVSAASPSLRPASADGSLHFDTLERHDDPPQQHYSTSNSVASHAETIEKENDGLSALERYRLRKQRKQGLASIDTTNNTTTSATAINTNHQYDSTFISSATPTSRGVDRRLPPAHPPSNSSSSYDEDEVGAGTTTIGGGMMMAAGTPSRSGRSKVRRSLSGGGAQRKVRRRTSLAPDQHPPAMAMQQNGERKSKAMMLPPSYPTHSNSSGTNNNERMEVDEQYNQLPPAATEQPSSSSFHHSQESIESVDSVAMRSRLHAMQIRIDNLEREKMELSMSKAPLEARIRQKEDSWVKERERLCAEIESHQSASLQADERFRELEMQNEALNEVVRKLRLEAREATSTAGGNSGGGGGMETDAWSERLKTNREIAELRKDLKDKDDQIKTLRMEKVSLESEVYGSKKEIEALERNYDELERDYGELEQSKSQNCEAEIQLEVLTTEHTAMTAQLNATSVDLVETRSRAKADLEAKEDAWKNRESELLFEISVLKSRAGKSSEDDVTVDMEGGEEDAAILKARIEARDRRIAELEEQLLSGEQLRRSLHNRIQELRGNIRVYVRTRPFLPNDGAARGSSIDILPDGESLTIQGRRGDEGHAFKFDKVFAPSSGQDVVFDEVSEFVQSALDGYHVCLFSYGQTGSGKTHTMQGSGNGAMRGIIPRAVEQILSQAAMMQSQRWTFTMKASFLEIYNEELRDLLVLMNADGSTKARDNGSSSKLSIKRNAEGKSFVDGINMVDIDVENKAAGLEQLEAVMVAAARARSVATTKMNAQSSRSHSVFMLHLCGSNEESGTVVQGALNLCDLAGSERLDRSGASSDARRLKETQAINKSLSSLGDVFTALANGSKHVPFRNSKLTYLLQDCLSGDGKALMFVNLSPTVESSNESLCSLRFAQRVNQVELGRATKHVQYIKGSGK